MKTKNRILFCVVSVISIVSCRSARPSTSQPSYFVGGEQAREGQFPATLNLGDCTGSKLNEYFILTAGHCVQDLDGTVFSVFRSGKILTTVSDVVTSEGKSFRLPIARTLIHHTYRKTAGMTEA